MALLWKKYNYILSQDKFYGIKTSKQCSIVLEAVGEGI